MLNTVPPTVHLVVVVILQIGKKYIVARWMETAKPCEESIWCVHEQGKWKTEGGSTPPLARKCQDDWRIYLHHSWGVFTQFNSRHKTLTNRTIINIGRHNVKKLWLRCRQFNQQSWKDSANFFRCAAFRSDLSSLLIRVHILRLIHAAQIPGVYPGWRSPYIQNNWFNTVSKVASPWDISVFSRG